MAVVARKTAFRWGRGLVVVLLTAAIGLAAVELLTPERYFGRGTVAAEVSVRVVPRLVPSAEAVRRRVLTTENLRAVAARLRGETVSDSTTTADEEASFERWRQTLTVEIRTTHDSQVRRIRFVALAGGRPSEAAVLVETVAAQYAGSLAAERWYGAIDRLRSAETAADATFEKLLEFLRDHRTAAFPELHRRAETTSAVPHNFPAVTAAPLDELSAEHDRELFRLVQQRERLLETLQPAHPQVAALDARLKALQATGAGTHVRRMSNEAAVDLTLPDFAEAPSAAPSESLPVDAAEAIQRWQHSRTAVRACLDELLEPAAAEFPVVSTVVSGLDLWEHRPFWQIAALTVALLTGIAVSWPRPGSSGTKHVAGLPTRTPTAARPISSTASVPIDKPTVLSARTVPRVEVIQTVEQAAAATGGPVLGVWQRRRDPPSTAA